LDGTTRKRYRQLAHQLHPVVMIGDGGVSEGVIAETNRALDDHELIKVKINVADREERHLLGERLLAACHAEPVQRIGKVLVMFRANPEAKAQLSNIR